jgi:hypothetical protein
MGHARPRCGGQSPSARPPLTTHPISVDLPGGWSCSFHFKQGSSGGYSGVAEIALNGLRHGELVIMEQPSLEAAVARMKLRASQFVRVRSAEGAQKPWRQRA